MTAVCRKQKLTLSFSVSPLETSVGKRKPTAMDGLIDRVTGLRVLMIIVEHDPALRDAVHECKTCFNKKDLARTLQIVVILTKTSSIKKVSP
jgi:hypothetical protein